MLKRINLEKNIQLCFNTGFDSLITANTDESYRNAIISIHNGLELLMKHYLRKKNELLIYRKITYKKIIENRTDLKKKVNLDKRDFTLSFLECINILEYFSELPEKNKKYLTQLGIKRNACMHYEYSYNEKELRKLLISHIYQFICDLISEMGLEPKEFILEKYIAPLDKYKNVIDDQVKQDYYTKIETAKKHYFEELTEQERVDKENTEDYTQRRYDKIVQCPACKKNALLMKEIQRTRQLTRDDDRITIRRDLILKDLSCHYCGLNITDYDQLKLEFKDEEKSLKSITIYHDYPDYYDCPDDCPPEYDCLTDCPDDCPPEYDCLTDCPDDCPPEYDCPDDCPDDCPI